MYISTSSFLIYRKQTYFTNLFVVESGKTTEGLKDLAS